MIGATVVTLVGGMVAVALMDLVVAAPRCVRHLRPLAAGAVSRLVPPVGAPARQLSTKQPSQKEQTM